jgi:hypothetical protein
LQCYIGSRIDGYRPELMAPNMLFSTLLKACQDLGGYEFVPFEKGDASKLVTMTNAIMTKSKDSKTVDGTDNDEGPSSWVYLLATLVAFLAAYLCAVAW